MATDGATLARTTGFSNRTMNPARPPVTSRTSTVESASEGASAMLAGDAISRLDFLTVLRVSGADAQDYLQGQLTANVDEVGESVSRSAAWCSPRGRVLALFRLFADPSGGFRVVCERWFAASLLARLRMFVLRADVRIDDAVDRLEVIGIAGMRALPNRFAAWAGTAEVDGAASFGDVTIARVPGRSPRFLLTGPPARVETIAPSQLLADGAPGTNPGAWRLADICAGVPRISAKSSGAFLPQMLNLDRFGAVSFEKGCYVGQEIVARAQHLGRIKRRAYVGWTTAAAEGDAIMDTTQDEARKVGDVVTVETHPDGGSVALVVLEVASAGSTALRVGQSDGPSIRISSPDSQEL